MVLTHRPGEKRKPLLVLSTYLLDRRLWVFATTTAGRGAGVGVRQTLARASTGRGAQLSTRSGHSEAYISFVAWRLDLYVCGVLATCGIYAIREKA